MTAVLSLLPVTSEDGAPVAAWTELGNLRTMTREYARELTDRTRDAIVEAGANLVELRAGSAHLALGYATWHDFVLAEFGDAMVWRLVRDRVARVAERQALVASLTLAGFTVREQREALGASVGTIHADQRQQGLVPDRPVVEPDPDPIPADPFRGLLPRWEALARVDAQGERGLTSLELDDELDAALGTATGSLSKLAARGWVRTVDGLDTLRRNRRPYVITAAGRVRLGEVLAARDAAEQDGQP
jgi:hypothetical protein